MSEGPADGTAMGDTGSPAGMARRIARICNQRGCTRARRRPLCQDCRAIRCRGVGAQERGPRSPATKFWSCLLLEAPPGTVIELTASGPQAEAAVTALARLIECKFDED